MSDATKRQDKPTGNGATVWSEVMADLAERVRLGKTKYGTELRVSNGRSALTDLYQELLDAVQYCKQRLMEDQLRFSSVSGLGTLELVALANLCADSILADGTASINAKTAAQSVVDHVPKASPTTTLRMLVQAIAEINDRNHRTT